MIENEMASGIGASAKTNPASASVRNLRTGTTSGCYNPRPDLGTSRGCRMRWWTKADEFNDLLGRRLD
jgi:hypothetical protein